jgi:hypothetical protein
MKAPTQFTAHEIALLIRGNRWDSEYFEVNQTRVTERINAKLRGEDIIIGGDNEAFIYRKCADKAEGDARETEQMVKYAGINPHVASKIELGAILYSSWGYDQTNVDFYCVIEMTAKMVKLLPLKRNTRVSEEGNGMAGKATAAKEINFRDIILTKKNQGDYVKIESYSHASLWDGKAKYESWYA